MKKFFLTTIAAFLMLATFGQLSAPSKEPVAKYKAGPPEFMSIQVDGSKAEITSQFTKKGFTKKETNGVLIFTGNANGTKMDVYCFFTPKSEKCWKFAVYLAEQTSWYALKGEYDKYVGILTEKYGKPEKDYAFFLSPYKEGDGYEMTAVAVDKCRYLSFWKEIYTVEITKFKQVKVSYENPENSALDDQERKDINNKTF